MANSNPCNKREDYYGDDLCQRLSLMVLFMVKKNYFAHETFCLI